MASTASRPPVHSPTTVTPGEAERSVRTRSRARASSSTINARISAMAERDREAHGQAAAVGTRRLDPARRAVEPREAFAGIGEPDAVALPGRRRAEAGTVVRDLELESRAVPGDPNRHMPDVGPV